ncbi:UDP-N-acetylglucosamine 2-epimerase (non-hydrolyzing) [bacterium]|nr:UDP-N-acetylglucosamine 2-epimerase (non-hydrolyzing) [bacterium]
MKKIVTIVGARPQFVKLAPVSAAIRQYTSDMIKEIIVHTGQHYDVAMSDIFFQELELPVPDHHLNVGSGSHAEQTAAIITKLEKVLIQEKPDMVIVYGDTNSTLAGALTASKLQIPLAHVEAGLRSYNRRMPEEINRIITDRLSSVLFCPTRQSIDWLSKEGISENVHFTGDVMYDAVLLHGRMAERKTEIMARLNIAPKKYLLATIHRAENTDDGSKLKNIFNGLSGIKHPIVLPAHPRLIKKIHEHQLHVPVNIQMTDPVSYLEMLVLEKNAMQILTDSGGIQKEAYFFNIPCITLREETEWIETLDYDCNVLAGSDPDTITNKANIQREPFFGNQYFGDGHAAEMIVKTLLTYLK